MTDWIADYRADVEKYYQNQTSGSNQPLSDEQATGLRLSILENLIENQILMESSVEEIGRIAQKLPEDSEIKEIFYPLMCFFQNTNPSAQEKDEIAKHAPDKGFDMAVLEILANFN